MNTLEEMANKIEIERLLTTVKYLEERLIKTESTIKDLLSDGCIEDKVDNLENKVDDLESELKGTTEKVSDLKDTVDDLESELKETTEKVDNLEDTSNLESELNESIRELEDRVQTEIEDLKSDMESSVDDMKLEVKKLDWIKRIIDPVQEKVEPSHPLLPL